MNKKVAIIIVAYNGEKYIRNCLESVFKTSSENDFSVFVIDNMSQDKTLEIIEKEFPQVNLIKLKENIGFARGNNIGIKKAIDLSYDCAVLLNQDTEVKSDWLFEIANAAYSDDKIAIAQSILVLSKQRDLINTSGNSLHYLGFGHVENLKSKISDFKSLDPYEIGYSSGAAMLLKLDKISEFGFFDEKFFMYHEDLDLCWRAKLCGYKIICAPKSVVYHDYEFLRNSNTLYFSERNRIMCVFTNYSSSMIFFIFPMFFVVEILMLFYSIFNGWFSVKLKTYSWIFNNFSYVLSRRRDIQKTRKIRDEEIFLSMESRLSFSAVDNFVLKYFVSPVVEFYYEILKNIFGFLCPIKK